ncbi:MAG TPA: hypothetical protein VLW84_02835 [Terriglobales bacterium]|nr:hypothetical protein [Terriglobales bacterium]
MNFTLMIENEDRTAIEPVTAAKRPFFLLRSLSPRRGSFQQSTFSRRFPVPFISFVHLDMELFRSKHRAPGGFGTAIALYQGVSGPKEKALRRGDL